MDSGLLWVRIPPPVAYSQGGHRALARKGLVPRYSRSAMTSPGRGEGGEALALTVLQP
ncbi:hypothetical protein BO78DRAFT_395181 [Aspergillus sclerotiicarbonarius CBS 121057]|uniref:Uncharacterized protein n=1 Tax=Aspergillus sclerotiicarbonarius (strain CBS 121057 / IBT 28362) TaxID=1448318 RepID=A0A319EN86_ASPSB|nr:hypothetical protein BO78DRAFT_395181 [Aspergillus sclerotiicarbonarius CBS 121057]